MPPARATTELLLPVRQGTEARRWLLLTAPCREQLMPPGMPARHSMVVKLTYEMCLENGDARGLAAV